MCRSCGDFSFSSGWSVTGCIKHNLFLVFAGSSSTYIFPALSLVFTFIYWLLSVSVANIVGSVLDHLCKIYYLWCRHPRWSHHSSYSYPLWNKIILSYFDNAFSLIISWMGLQRQAFCNRTMWNSRLIRWQVDPHELP